MLQWKNTFQFQITSANYQPRINLSYLTKLNYTKMRYFSLYTKNHVSNVAFIDVINYKKLIGITIDIGIKKYKNIES